MKKQNVALGLYRMGLLLAVSMAGIGTQSLMVNLRTLTMEELALTVWADGGPLLIFWGMSVTLGAILVGIGAFIYVKTKPVFPWLIGIGVLAIVFMMVVMFPRIYNPTLPGFFVAKRPKCISRPLRTHRFPAQSRLWSFWSWVGSLY